MAYGNLFTNMNTAEWILNFAIHSLVVLSAGWFFLSLFKRKSAPLRSNIIFVTMLALLLLPLFSVLYQSFDITFYKTSLPFTGDSRLSYPEVSDGGTPAVSADYNAPTNLSEVSGVNVKKPSQLSMFFQSILSRTTTANVINAAGIIWLVGFILLLGRLLYGATSLSVFKKGLTKIEDVRLDNILQKAQKMFRFRSLPEVYASQSAKSPVVLGIARPIIVLPQRVYRKLSNKEIRSILFHELSHIYHKDQVTGVLQRIVTALYWWNPFVHTLSTDYSKAREEISDNHAIMGNTSREYAECLVNLAEKTALVNRLPFLQGLAIPHIPLKYRISQILSKERIMATETKKSTTLIILLAFIVSLGLLAGHKWTFASDKAETEMEIAQETQMEIQKEKAIEQEKEQEKEKKIEKEKKAEKAQEETATEQEKEEIEKMLKELKIKLNAINLDLYPVKIYVKPVKDWNKLVLAKDVCVSTQLAEELKQKFEELRAELKLVKVDTDHNIHLYIEPVPVQEKELSEEQKEKIRKKLEELKVKLSELHLDVTPKIKVDLKRDFKVDADGKVVVEVKPVLVVKVKPEFPEEAKEKGIYGEVKVEGTTDKKGNVISVKVLKSSHKLLDEAVIEAIKQWKYELPEYKGKTYAITFVVTVRFNPKDKDGNSWTVSINN